MTKRQLFSLFNRARKSKRRELFILIFCLIVIVVFANPKSFTADAYSLDIFNQKSITGKVVKVSDGDTITVLDKDYAEHKIRFFGIDAPESKQAYGQKAKNYLASLIAGKEVKVVITGTDKYQRKVAHAYTEYSKDYVSEELTAKEAKIGLWKDKNPIKPSEFRRQQKGQK